MRSFLKIYKTAAEKNETLDKVEDNSSVVKDYINAHLLGEVAAIPPALLGAQAISSSQARLHKLRDKDLEKLLKVTKLKDKVYPSYPAKNLIRIPFTDNAWYSSRPYKVKKYDPKTKKNKVVKKYRKGSVSANTRRLWRPGVMAHELGHAHIENNPGLIRLLQRYAYGPTKKLNNLTFGAIPTLASFKANENEDDQVKGFLKGGLIGTGLNAGVLIPEIEASRRGIKYLLRTSLSRKRKLLNALSLIPPFGTYLIGAAGPSAVAGAYRAHKNKKKKTKKEKKAEFFSKIANFIKASGSDIDIMFDRKVETEPKNPFDGRLKKNKPIVEIKEKELEPPKLHTHKVKLAIEKLKGGAGDYKADSAFSSVELRNGIKHELEHTKNKSLAKEIAKDHLSEVKNYYSKLEKADIE